jgi:hypothetical protein
VGTILFPLPLFPPAPTAGHEGDPEAFDVEGSYDRAKDVQYETASRARGASVELNGLKVSAVVIPLSSVWCTCTVRSQVDLLVACDDETPEL